MTVDRSERKATRIGTLWKNVRIVILGSSVLRRPNTNVPIGVAKAGIHKRCFNGFGFPIKLEMTLLLGMALLLEMMSAIGNDSVGLESWTMGRVPPQNTFLILVA